MPHYSILLMKIIISNFSLLQVANAHTKPKGESLEPEDYALWEYPCYPLSGVQTLMNFDFTRPLPPHEVLQVEGK